MGLKLVLCPVQRSGSICTKLDYKMIMFGKKDCRLIVVVFLPSMYPVLLNTLCQYQHLENSAINIYFSFGYIVVMRETAALCKAIVVVLFFPTV